MSELLELHRKYDSVKARPKYPYSQRFLTDIYPMYLNQRRRSATSILEVGCWKGGSLLAVRDYFARAKVVGVDLVDLAKPRVEGEPRIRFYQGSQNDSAFLKSVCAQEGPFDFIIEDGSHKYADQVCTYESTFASLKLGGVYFVEDVIPDWKGHRILDYFKNLVTPNSFSTIDVGNIAGIAFYAGLIAITKGRA